MELKRVVSDTGRDPKAKLHASLALLPVDPNQAVYLEERLLDSGPKDLRVLRDALRGDRSNQISSAPTDRRWAGLLGDALRGDRSKLVPKLWSILDLAKPDDPRILPAAGTLALYEPANLIGWSANGDKVAQSLVSVNFVYLKDWLDDLREVRNRLKPPLAAIFRDKTRTAAVHAQATNILADYAGEGPPPGRSAHGR